MPILTTEKRDHFDRLFAEFARTYPHTPDGQRHIEGYAVGRQSAQENWSAVKRMAERGEDVTDAVLLKLLPYSDSKNNREKGAWIHLAPTINGDIKKWYENAGWTKPEDWPRVTRAIFEFVQRCVDHPEQLAAACLEFAQRPYAKGFQSGTLSPVLNALRPDDFVLINNKPRDAINYFADASIDQALTDYPQANQIGHQLVDTLARDLVLEVAPHLRPADVFDMFSHWLRAVKHFRYQNVNYWKVAPGKNAWQWAEWQQEGFAAIGWDALGDICELSRSEYEERRDQLAQQHKDYSSVGMDQVWRFVHEIKEGDRIIANQGKSLVLGIGTVVGPPYFVEGEIQRHRFPVEWDDLQPRAVNEYGWRRTLIQLDRDKYESILQAVVYDGEIQLGNRPVRLIQKMEQIREGAEITYEINELAPPFDHLFANREEAEWAFDLMAHALHQLGIEDPENQIFVTSLPSTYGARTIRLLYGNWVILGFCGRSLQRVGTEIILFNEEAAEFQQYKVFDFSQGEDEPSAGLYAIPYEVVRQQQSKILENFDNVCVHVLGRFGHWNAANKRSGHWPVITEAILNPEMRSVLFQNGLTEDGQLRIEGATGVAPDTAFTKKTFHLLSQIHDSPTMEFYQEHKDGFLEYVEKPFKRVFQTVSERLPTSVLRLMETEKYLFGRFPKNDFGQGGTWDFYWGAIYPKGSKRSEDAQLAMSIRHDLFKFGFSIGHYADEQRRRFERNCARHFNSLKNILADALSDEHFVFGPQAEYQLQPSGKVIHPAMLTWTDFLQTPSSAGYEAFYVLPRVDVLQLGEEELVQTVLRTHMRLFPLVLLATEEDPLPAIRAYHEEIGVEPDTDLEADAPTPVPYSSDDFLAKTYLTTHKARELRELLLDRKQMILYGPPGTGKSFVAQYLAKWLTNLAEPSSDRVEMVQFHPAYGYEDFIEGIRAESFETQDGHHAVSYPTRPGLFVQFCRRAALADAEQPHVFIIDEINRGNIARIFGELMLLLEYRDRDVPLPYSGERFKIPSNVYLIGTMNTADRSIALVDFALRRRFHFAHFAADPDLFARWLASNPVEPAYLEPLYRRLATEAIDDPNFAIGPSYFMKPNLTEGKLERIWRYSIEPYLAEYYIDQPNKAAAWHWDGDIVKGLRGQA
ncbi:AAA domain-containing protein [bacterium]|nr:AAA domain-containing protein [bacterium]